MTKGRLLSSAEIFAEHAPKFSHIELVPGGFADPSDRGKFYLQPARGGKRLRFDYLTCDGGPPSWPYIDVRQADLIVEFKYDGINEERSPLEALRDAFFEAIKTRIFVGRTFRLSVPELNSRERLPLKILVEGEPVPGWVDHSDMWADPSVFFDPASREYEIYCLTLRAERSRQQSAEIRRQMQRTRVTLAPVRAAQAALTST